MTAAVPEESAANAGSARLRADSLAESVVMLMALTLIQPVVSFVRSILFCRWLDPGQLGEWDLALGFLTLAAPLVVLGIPGSFGRYVEHYRQRGQLRRFLWMATVATSALCLIAAGAVYSGAGPFSQLLLGAGDHQGLIRLLGFALVPLVAFGFVTELLNAFRLYRLVSLLQLFRSASFLVLGALLLLLNLGAWAVVAAYAVASCVTAVLGARWLLRLWRDLPDEPAPHGVRRDICRRVMPFALWVWTCNNLTNLFEVADRYLLVHYSGLSPDRALELVGNYHSSRVVPLLIVVFAGMLGSILLPHLSHAWETGRRDQVAGQLRLGLKLFGVSVTAGAAVFLWIAPWLFRVTFEGKYDAGLAVLPLTLLYCIWFGLGLMAEMYLWCREEARLASFALLAGLVVGIAFNLLLLPSFGLLGAVLACCASRLTLLLAVLGFGRMLGLRFDWGTWIGCALPLALLLGPAPALGVCGIIALGGLVSPSLLGAEERSRLATVVAAYGHRLRGLRQRALVSPADAPCQGATSA